MITLMEGLPDHVVVAEAHGQVSADDYEQVLVPAVEEATAGEAKARFLYVLADDFAGFEAGAALDDAKVGLRHWNDFERLGVVTDHGGYRGLVSAMRFLLPGEVRVFEGGELDAALQWIAGE